jgi:hypothetical protein
MTCGKCKAQVPLVERAVPLGKVAEARDMWCRRCLEGAGLPWCKDPVVDVLVAHVNAERGRGGRR